MDSAEELQQLHMHGPLECTCVQKVAQLRAYAEDVAFSHLFNIVHTHSNSDNALSESAL